MGKYFMAWEKKGEVAWRKGYVAKAWRRQVFLTSTCCPLSRGGDPNCSCPQVGNEYHGQILTAISAISRSRWRTPGARRRMPASGCGIRKCSRWGAVDRRQWSVRREGRRRVVCCSNAAPACRKASVSCWLQSLNLGKQWWGKPFKNESARYGLEAVSDAPETERAVRSTVA